MGLKGENRTMCEKTKQKQTKNSASRIFGPNFVEEACACNNLQNSPNPKT